MSHKLIISCKIT